MITGGDMRAIIDIGSGLVKALNRLAKAVEDHKPVQQPEFEPAPRARMSPGSDTARKEST